MNTTTAPLTEPALPSSTKPLAIRLFAVGNAGLNVLDHLTANGLANVSCVAINSEPQSLAGARVTEKIYLETKPLRGLGTGGDPDRGRLLAEENTEKLKALCEGQSVVFILAGLGGGAGTGVSPVLARVAKECGALVLCFVTTPFACEGSRRQRLAEAGYEELAEAADGVICLPNEKLCKMIDENTSVLDTFKLSNNLLGDGVRGIWQLLTYPGLIEIHADELSALIRERHSESRFAVAEAMGATRSREVIDRLLGHPLLEHGAALSESEAVLVSLMGGPDLTMAEVNRVMEQIRAKCGQAQVVMGTAIDESFRERLSVTLIAARSQAERDAMVARTTARAEDMEDRLLKHEPTPRATSRFVAPAPAVTPARIEQLQAQQVKGNARTRKAVSKMLQTTLPLEIISKGRFEKSEPTIHKGEDLDVPTYIRRGVLLN